MDGEMNEVKCEECENWKRRGDELFDECDRLQKLIAGQANYVVLSEESYNLKCDEYKKLILLNAKLRLLLAENGIDHDL